MNQLNKPLEKFLPGKLFEEAQKVDKAEARKYLKTRERKVYSDEGIVKGMDKDEEEFKQICREAKGVKYEKNK